MEKTLGPINYGCEHFTWLRGVNATFKLDGYITVDLLL